MSEQENADRLNEFALEPLAILHNEGWGPNSVEIDSENNEVKLVFERAIE